MTGNWLLTSSAPGDVASTPVLGFAQRDPLNPAVVNLDTDRNADPGRTIVRGGWTYFGSATKVQRFAYDPGTAFTAAGRIKLDLYPQYVELATILEYAAAHGVSGEWVTLLKRRLAAYKRRAALNEALASTRGALASARDRLRAGVGT